MGGRPPTALRARKASSNLAIIVAGNGDDMASASRRL